MKYRYAGENKIDRYIRSAGKTFLAVRLEDLISRAEELDDSRLFGKLIEEYYKNQIGTFDREITGTATRVRAARYILAADQTVFVLESIQKSNLSQDIRKKAEMTLEKIRSGELKLPQLS